MSLSDLASLGSFVSGLAVLVSLVFLYFQVRQVNQQVRQAEKNQQAAIRQGRTATAVQIALTATDRELAIASNKVALGAADLTDAELNQALAISRAVFFNYEDAFYQHREGLLDETAFAGWVRTVEAGLAYPNRRVAWRWSRNAYGVEFAAFMDGLLYKVPVSRPDSSVARWREDLAAELAGAQ